MLRDAQHIRQVVLALTTYCNLACPECVANIPLIACPEQYGEKYIEQAASCFFGIEHVHLSGGEPTAHPDFNTLIPRLKNMFGCRTLSMVTNGCNVVKYADVLKHLDEIFISHYPHNQDAVEFVSQHFGDHETPGPTLHVCTARRALQPAPCSRAYTVKYMYGRLYPCCAIPSGLESIGIPLTPHWRDEILDIPLPCESCCFAEEHFSESTITYGDIAAIDRDTHYSTEERPVTWPALRSDIAIYGLELDSWMRRNAIIGFHPPEGVSRLCICFESHTPEDLYPITLTFESVQEQTVHTFAITHAGSSETSVELSQVVQCSSNGFLKMRCDTVFVPCHINENTPDTREVGVRIVSLRYA